MTDADRAPLGGWKIEVLQLAEAMTDIKYLPHLLASLGKRKRLWAAWVAKSIRNISEKEMIGLFGETGFF